MPEKIEDLHRKNEKEIEKKADEYARIQKIKNDPEEMKRLDSKYLVDKKERKDRNKRTVAGFVPFVGSGMDLKEAKSGKEYFTGKKLTKKERVVKGVFGVGGMALDVATFGADRIVVGVGERAAEAGMEKGVQTEARNVAEKQSVKKIQTKNNENYNRKGFISGLRKFDISGWLDKKKKLNKNRNMFENIWPNEENKEGKD